MEDLQNGSYLMAGGIWTALQNRRSIARMAGIKSVLTKHITRTLYDNARAEMLELISRKIGYKEHLIKRFDIEFSDALHKQLTNVTGEINTLMGFIMAFDQMAEFQANELAAISDHAFTTHRQNIALNVLLDAQTERAITWSNTAHDLHDHILTGKRSTVYA